MDWAKGVLCAIFIFAFWLLAIVTLIAARVAVLKLEHKLACLFDGDGLVMITASVAFFVENRLLLLVLVYFVDEVLILDEVVHRLDQVLVDIVAIVRHANRRHESAWPEAPIFQCICMLDRNQEISLSMQDETRAGHSVHLAQIIELLRQKVRQKANFT